MIKVLHILAAVFWKADVVKELFFIKKENERFNYFYDTFFILLLTFDNDNNKLRLDPSFSYIKISEDNTVE